jgi:hypothetical protein
MAPKSTVRHRIHNSPSPAPVLKQINPVYASHYISWSSILKLSSHLRRYLIILSSMTLKVFGQE